MRTIKVILGLVYFLAALVPGVVALFGFSHLGTAESLGNLLLASLFALLALGLIGIGWFLIVKRDSSVSTMAKVIVVVTVIMGVFPAAWIAVVLIGMQVVQRGLGRIPGTNFLQGVVLDQEGKPLPDVELNFQNSRRLYLIFPPGLNTPNWVAVRNLKTTTDQRGEFIISFRSEFLEFADASKPGYRQDGKQAETGWRVINPGVTQHTSLRIVAESAIRQDQIHKFSFDAVSFPPDGNIFVNLREGKISDVHEADILLEWRRLPATASHGEYGKFVIRASDGGVLLWEQERLFAPIDGYEDGIEFFFGPNAIKAYMKLHRAELFLKSRNGQLYARVFVQLDTAQSTLSLRARVNASGNNFVDAKADNYEIGVYPSLSPIYMNPGIPWWIEIEPNRGQIIVKEDRLRTLLSNDPGLMFHRYFAEYYQTPPDVLKTMLGGDVVQDHFVPQALAQNLGAPLDVLQQLATNAWTREGLSTNLWGMVGMKSQATLALPEDVRRFLAGKE
jgi:hypothetical protein